MPPRQHSREASLNIEDRNETLDKYVSKRATELKKLFIDEYKSHTDKAMSDMILYAADKNDQIQKLKTQLEMYTSEIQQLKTQLEIYTSREKPLCDVPLTQITTIKKKILYNIPSKFKPNRPLRFCQLGQTTYEGFHTYNHSLNLEERLISVSDEEIIKYASTNPTQKSIYNCITYFKEKILKRNTIYTSRELGFGFIEEI
jgi:hypothetical protein